MKYMFEQKMVYWGGDSVDPLFLTPIMSSRVPTIASRKWYIVRNKSNKVEVIEVKGVWGYQSLNMACSDLFMCVI